MYNIYFLALLKFVVNNSGYVEQFFFSAIGEAVLLIPKYDVLFMPLVSNLLLVVTQDTDIK